MIGFLEKFVWVLTIFVILANMALVVWWQRTAPSKPDDLTTGKVENIKLSELGKLTGGSFDATKSRSFYKAPGAGRQSGSSGASDGDFSTGVSSIEKRGDIEVKITPKYVREALIEKYRNFPELYDEISKSDARFETDVDGQPVVVVTKVAKNSLVDRIGLKVKDKVLSVNNSPIKGPNEAKELYEKLKNERNFVVEIERNGKIEYFYYQIRK